MFTHALMKMMSIPMQCECVQPGFTGKSRGGMVKLPGGHIYEKKDVGMDVGLPC